MFNLFNTKKDMTAIFNATDNLARKTCLMGMYIAIKQEQSFLNHSELTRTDSVIFSAYLNSMLILSDAKNRNIAKQVTDRYFAFVHQILEEDGGCFDDNIPSETISKMFVNRISFYTSVLQSRSNIKAAIGALVEEFEYIIKTDIVHGKYIPFSESSPLPILGFEKDIRCQIEVRNYPSFTTEILADPISELLKLIK